MELFISKAQKELDGIILRLEMNMSNNYKDAADPIHFIHSRMPLIMPEDKIDDWIKPDSNPESLLEYALSDMISEKA